MVPATVHFGLETFVDSVDPTPAFYDRLRTTKQVPTTSTPSPGAFREVFERLHLAGHEIISIHVMATKSALFAVAGMGAQMAPEAKVHTVDSHSTTMGLGLLTIMAARAAQEGRTAVDILAMLQRQIPRVDIFAAIPQMTQLRKSGRVSLGRALVADALAVKPILYLGRSVVEVVDKVRGWPRAVERMVEMARERAGGARVRLAVVHTDAEAEAKALLERIAGRFNHVEMMVVEAGTALATHAGPGVLGLVTLQEE